MSTQKSLSQEQQRYLTALKYTHLRMLREKFTSCIFPPFLVSIAGVLMRSGPTHNGSNKAWLNSDLVPLSAGGPRNSGCISGVRFVSALQISLLWRTPWTYPTFARAYGSASESRKREIRVSDEDDDDVEGEQHLEDDDDDVEDEQYISDDDDDDDDEEDEDEEEGQVMQSQGPVKKKIQTKPPKSKSADRESHTLNQDITAKIVRLVNDDEGHRIVSREEALALAKDKNLDLVLVDGRSDPPVCKIFDFHKEEYRQEQMKKERKKKKGAMVKLNEMKELRFNAKTEPKDLKMKVEKAKQLMERGYRVKFVANLKGSFDDEKKRQEQEKMINSIYALIEDIAVIEQGPRLETRHAWLVLRHVKFGQNKKKPSKDKLKIGVTDQGDNMEDGVEIHRESDYSAGHEEKNTEPFQSSFPAKPEAGFSMQPSTLRSPHEVRHPQVQSLPPQDPNGLRTLIQPPLPHAFPQHTPSLQAFGGMRGSETLVLPPHGFPLAATPILRGAGVQGLKMQVSPAGGSSLDEAGHSHLQSPPVQNPDEGLKSQTQPVSPRAFPQHASSLQGFGGLRGFEAPVSPPRSPPPSTPTLQDARTQGLRMQVSPPDGSPLINLHDAGHSHLQPPPSQDPYEGLISGMQPPPSRGFSQHTPSLKGVGGFGMPVSPPSGPAPSTRMLQGAGAQRCRMFPTPPQACEAGLSRVQLSPPQDSDFGVQPPPPRGFGGLQGSEALVPPLRGPPPSTPILQGAGVQDSRMLFPPPGSSPVHAREAVRSYVQPPPPRDHDGLRSRMHPPPAHGSPGHASFLQGFGGSRGAEMPVSSPRGFPQHTPILQGFGGQGGSEAPVSPPPGPPPFTPMAQGAGVPGPRIQVAPPRGFPPHAQEASHPHVQHPPLLNLDGFRSPGMQRPPSGAFPQHTSFPEGFGGVRGSETLVSPPPQGPLLFTPSLQGVGGQGSTMQTSPHGGFPLHAHEASHSQGQPPTPQDSDEGLTSGMQVPRRGFPRHTSTPQGFGGIHGSEAYGFQKDGQSHQQKQPYQGYPPQRGFPQTRPAQEAYSPQGGGQIHPQSQVSQGYPPPRGFLQTRPAAPPLPPPPEYRPSWSRPPPQSQQYSPLFEPPSEKS